MGPHLDAGYPGKGAIVHESETATGLDSVAEPLFFAALLDIRALRVADRDADRAPLGRSLSQHVIEPRVRLVQEDGRIHQHVDVLAGLRQHVDEGGHGDVRPLVVESHKFRTDGAGRACLPDLVHYEAPEIARSVLAIGVAEATQPADIYALGASLLISATGWRAVEYPDDAPRPVQRQAIVDGKRRTVRVPGELGGLVEAMLSPAPQDRPTIYEVGKALS